MARLNINSLGISKLKWTRMGEFNSDDHYIYYFGQEFLKRNGVVIIINRRVRNAVLGCNLKKWQNDLSLFPRQIFEIIPHHSNPSLCPNHWCRRSWSWPVLWRPTIPSRTNTKKKKEKTTTKMFFSSQETGMRKSNEELSLSLWGKWGSQEIPGIIGKFGLGVRNEAGKG